VASRARKLVESLVDCGITRLVDVRLNPCASDPVPGRPYGPKAWNLQAGDAGIVALLAPAGIAYEWNVELGNPQRQDHTMTILLAQLADTRGDWPVHRGLRRLAERIRENRQRIALLCTCASAAGCHRTTIAQEVSRRFFHDGLTIRDIGRG
jgi:hypothetical protein